MQITIFTFITLALGVASAFAAPAFSVYAIACLLVMGAAAAIIVGGAGILPANLFALFYCYGALRMKDGARLAASGLMPWQPGFFLLLLVGYGVVSAYFWPRFFEGATDVIFADRSLPAFAQFSARPLHPGSGNVTQAIYAIGGLAVFAATIAYVSYVNSRVFINAIIAAALLNSLCGLLDMMTSLLGIEQVLSFLRSAPYAILSGQEVAGFRRVIGSFPEPSSFAAFSFAMFVGTFVIWLHGAGGRLAMLAVTSNLIFLIISTSTTGYVALALFVIAFVAWLPRALAASMWRQKAAFVLLIVLLGASVVGALLVAGVELPGVEGVVDQTLAKSQSASAIERAAMNGQAWVNFIDTNGFGAGLGSARASSFVMVLLSNLGVPGVLLFTAFIVSLLAATQSNPSHDDLTLSRCCKGVAAGVVAANAISGGVFDLGLLFYLCAGIVAGLHLRTSAYPLARIQLPATR